jgi:hypothetical protein
MPLVRMTPEILECPPVHNSVSARVKLHSNASVSRLGGLCFAYAAGMPGLDSSSWHDWPPHDPYVA